MAMENPNNKAIETVPTYEAFENSEFGRLDIITIDGVQWLIGKQAATMLGYSITHKAIADHVDDDDKRLLTYEELQRFQIGSFASPRGLMLINEFGFNALVMRSKLKEARRIQRWVTHDVMPSIRKHGAYMTPAVIEKVLYRPDFIINLATRLKEEQEKVAQLTEKVEEMAPKSAYCDAILQCPDVVTVTSIAKDYGMSARSFNILLCKMRIQYKVGKLWVLYQEYAAAGYTQTKSYLYDGHSIQLTCWTQKGRLFLYETLKIHGYLPTIERKG